MHHNCLGVKYSWCSRNWCPSKSVMSDKLNTLFPETEKLFSVTSEISFLQIQNSDALTSFLDEGVIPKEL